MSQWLKILVAVVNDSDQFPAPTSARNSSFRDLTLSYGLYEYYTYMLPINSCTYTYT